jgi:hypothetical protein
LNVHFLFYIRFTFDPDGAGIMSRLWDTPDFWARSEADELLRDHPDTEVRALAESLARGRSDYGSDPGFARDIVAELHKRADAGIRFWPQVAGIEALEDELREMLGAIAAEEEETPQVYWWQRM